MYPQLSGTRSREKKGKSMKLFLTITLMLGLSAIPGWAGFDEGLQAAKNGDHVTALREFLPLAKQGNAVAQYNVGLIYEKFHGDYAAAAQWYLRAAEQGNAQAQNELGTLYHDGQGVPQNYVQAYVWYSRAAARLSGPMRDVAVRNRDRIAKGLTSEQLIRAQEIANAWQPKQETPATTRP
jgi:hypothetical protein